MNGKKKCSFTLLLGFCITFLITKTNCLPTTTIIDTTTPTPSFVVTTTDIPSDGYVDKKEVKEGDSEKTATPKIYEMKIFANVSDRFAHTSVTSKVKNLAPTAQEATFSVILPENAYISGFIMEIGGKSYKAYVKEKEEAKQEYDQAVASGISAGHVVASARDSNRFVVSTNIEPQSKAVFHLFYEELLQRNNDQYDIILNIHPGQPVKNLEVEVLINESRPLKFVKTSPLRSGNEIEKYKEELDPRADINMINATSALVKFKPNAERQKQLAESLGKDANEGISGQFVVHYAVENYPTAGEVLLNDGYFVHFFAPDDLTPLSKQVVFVLDTSGSMYDRKLEQLKEAMYSILGELREEDFFNIVEFNTNVKVWDLDQNDKSIYYPNTNDHWYTDESPVDINSLTLPSAYPANEDNKKKAKDVIKQLDSNGGTNIYEALRIGLHLVELKKNNTKDAPQPLIVFLTDGDPTVGISDPEKIISKISEINSIREKSPIFSLSFGEGADKNFLQKLALHNLGFSRHIYEAADASLQLQNFYKQISSPLLANVKFVYTAQTSELTKTEFPIIFRGSELVVAGKITDNLKEFTDNSKIDGVRSSCEPISFFFRKVTKPVSSLERLWAYLTVRQLLEARETASNKTVYEKKALDLALKYSFVTAISSLVVVKPNATKTVNTEEANQNQGSSIRSFAAPVPSFSALGYSSLRSGVHYARFGSGSGGYSSNRKYAANTKASALSLSRPIIPLAASFGSAPLYETASFDIVDKIALPPPVSTTVSASTQQNVVATTEEDSIYDDINMSLPWLSTFVKNNTITTPKGDLKLGTNDTVIANTPECTNSVNSTTGNCTLLHECPQMFKFLTDMTAYHQYFCPINNEYAGVCCPKKDESKTEDP